MEDLSRKLAEEYFSSELELLPDGAFERLERDQPINVVSVKGASQIDVGSAVAVIKCIIDVVRFVYEVYSDRQERANRQQDVIAKIRKDYPQIAAELDDADLKSFVEDLVNG